MFESLPTSPVFSFLIIILGLLIIVWAILWVSLPFAIFGIKEKFNDLIIETKITNEQLEKLRALIVIMIKLQKDSKYLTKKSNNKNSDSKASEKK